MSSHQAQSFYPEVYVEQPSISGTPSLNAFHAYKSINGKCLETRTNGRFYTHEFIGKNIANLITNLAAKSKEKKLKIVEPFCGDGRLVCWLLETIEANSSFSNTDIEIEIWDNDSEALNAAVKNIKVFAQEIGSDVTINHRCIDTFLKASEHFGKFDICITNPPWENLKPDSRELERLTEDQKIDYIKNIKVRAAMLDKLYPMSKPIKKFSGWGTNLSRCGTEISLRLLKQNGIAGIVLPATLFADQVSETIRTWIFDKHAVQDLSYYSAETRLFDGVDQPVITIVCSSQSQEISAPKSISSYDKSLKEQKRKLPDLAWEEIRKNGFSFPSGFHLAALEVSNLLNGSARFNDLESGKNDGLWAGRELDETGRHRFVSSEGKNPFIKGRTIKRFGLAESPSEFLTENALKVPESKNFHRVVWRDVARHSQKRRIHATIIPPEWVTGNSLHVAYFRDNNLDRLYALLGVMNSLTFEAMCRTHIATGHVSLGSVRKTPIPNLYDISIVLSLSKLARKVCEFGFEAEAELEIAVAKSYGLNRQEFEQLLSVFDKVSDSEKEAYLLHPLWEE